jgi:hypothetical protein
MGAALAALVLSSALQAAGVARISIVEGRAEMMRKGAKKWRPARPGMELMVGDHLYSREESFVEVSYKSGAVVRLDENSKIMITDAGPKGVKSRSGVGEVWVNMRKLVSSGKEFELTTPTATAAIRGTVFHTATGEDWSTDVAVYEGKVAVGPSQDLQDRMKEQEQKEEEESGIAPGGPTEVPGPEEVPGPYEVSLEEWLMIVAGQRISVRKDGKYAQEPFDMDKAREDAFVKRNLVLDEQQGAGKKDEGGE